LYQDIKEEVHKFIVESVSNIASISFGFYNQDKLEDKEAKDYAAKNIILNVHSILNKIMTTVRSHSSLQTLPEEIKKMELKKMELKLTLDVDQMLSDVMVNLADYYPQASAAGSTPRMRETINEINLVDDEQNDFIFANKIGISKYLKIEKDKD
jgi:hypothetical protein